MVEKFYMYEDQTEYGYIENRDSSEVRMGVKKFLRAVNVWESESFKDDK